MSVRFVALLVLGVGVFGAAGRADAELGWWMWTPGDHVDDSTQNMFDYGYHPDQPIAFSHEAHVTKRGISCQHCHTAARRSTSAGLPSVDLCMGCHKYVRTESEEIKKLTAHYEAKDPVRWVKVNDLPDYVRFSHQVHVLAKDDQGNLLLGEDEDEVCKTCHGPVETMTTYSQYTPLQMGWCIGCHIKLRPVATPDEKPKPYASVSCAACHY